MKATAIAASTASDINPIISATTSADALDKPISCKATTALNSRRPQPPIDMGRLAANITMQEAAISEAKPICGASCRSRIT